MKIALLILTWFLAVAIPASAQELQTCVETLPQGTAELLGQRGREYLRLGNPSELSGTEEGDNDPVRSAPALAEAERGIRLVDPEENYARRLAMYSGRTTFHRPLDTRYTVPRDGTARSRRARVPVTESSPVESFSWFHWIVLTLTGPILIVGLLRRVSARARPALTDLAAAKA